MPTVHQEGIGTEAKRSRMHIVVLVHMLLGPGPKDWH